MNIIQKSNKQFMILSAIGIVIMLVCHLAGDIYKYIKFFPFVPIFVFISGYFYKDSYEEKIGKFIWHKFKKLMIPFFIANFIYGIVVQILKHFGIIHYGENLSLYTIFIQPFINNSQFVFNFPAWFVPTLFIVNVVYVFIHKLSNKIKLPYTEELLLIIFIILNILSVHYSYLISNYDFIIILLKLLFLLPFMQFGHFYKIKLQKKDEKIWTIPYLLLCITINIILFKIFGVLNYDLHEFSNFNNSILTFISSIIGILFFTRISKILCNILGKNNFINYISNNTYSIMTHHLFAVFLLDYFLYFINIKIKSIPYFDIDHFRTGWIYIYQTPFKYGNILIQILYVLVGIAVPLIFKYIYDKLKEFLDSKKQLTKSL